MKLITRDTDYAIRALMALARHADKTVPVPTLVKELRIPRPFLRKILQRLHGAGILTSVKGQGGGFSITRAVDAIRITDLMRIFQGPVKLNECLFRKRPCPNRPSCPLKKRIDRIEKAVITELESITIGSIL